MFTFPFGFYQTSGDSGTTATVTIDHTKVSADLTDFPVYINLSDMPPSRWYTVTNGGGDIRCYKSDGTTELPREVVSCDTSTETGELRVKYSGTLSSSTDTEIQVKVDGVSSDYAASDTYGSENVWGSSYEIVSHDGGLSDSTSNSNDGTNNGATTATGEIGDALSFDGTNDFVNLGDIDFTVDYTVSFLIKASKPSSRVYFLDKYDSASNYPIIISMFTDGKLTVYTRNGGVTKSVHGTTDIADGTRKHVTVTRSSNLVDIYINSSVDLNNGDLTYTTITNNNLDLRLGKPSWDSEVLDGDIDELRITMETKSSNRAYTEHENQLNTSTFYSVFTEDYTVPTTGLVAEYLLDGNANDTSGNGNNGTENGGLSYTTPSGASIQVADFDGTDDWIETNLNIGTTFTLSARVNPDTFNGTPDGIFSTLPTSTNRDGIDIGHHSSAGWRMVFFNNNSAPINTSVGSVTASTGTWYHVVVTYDGSDAKFYLDKSNILSGTGTITGHDDGLNLGRQYADTASNDWDGKMCLVRVYDSVLTSDDIENLYLEGQDKLGLS